MSDFRLTGAATVCDYEFTDMAAYAALLSKALAGCFDFYVLSVGPGPRARIAFCGNGQTMIKTDALRNVDPLHLVEVPK